MYSNLSKNGQTIGFLLGAVLSVLFVGIMVSGWDSFVALGASPENYQTGIFDFGMYASIGLVIAGVLAILSFGIAQMASDPKSAIKGIAGVALLGVIFFITYSMADGEATGAIARSIENVGGLSANALKLIGGAISTSIILSLVAAGAIVVAELVNFFK
jgi:hypothetical protein